MTQSSTDSTFVRSALSITGGAARTKLENALVETLAIDPTNFTEARQRLWINTVDGHIKYTANAGVTIKTVTNTDDGPTVFINDTFDRADNNTTLGTATSGQAWTAVSGTWGISNNEGYCVSDASGNKAILPTVGTGDYTTLCTVRGDMDPAGNNFRRAAVMVRYIDALNFLYVFLDNGNVFLSKTSAGSSSFLQTASQTTVDNVDYVVKVISNGGNMKVYVDNVLKIDNTLSSGDITKYASSGVTGIYLEKNGAPAVAARWNNFSVIANA